MSSRSANTGSQNPLVFCDIETTGLIQGDVMPDIIQIAAVYEDDDDVFDRYILPDKAMTPGALRVTGISVEGDTLLRHGERLPTVRLREAMAAFLSWLEEVTKDAGKKPILLAYNGDRFDVPVLRNAFRKCKLESEAKNAVAGCADPYQMATALIPKYEVENYKLDTLTRTYCQISHDAHNAVGDCKALKEVYYARLQKANITTYTFSF